MEKHVTKTTQPPIVSDAERLAALQKEQKLVEEQAASQERERGIKPFVVKINLPR